MSKKVIIFIIIIVGLILLFPIPMHLLDGGSVEYKALLYTITKYHKLAPIEEGKDVTYIEGLGIKILGKEIYNNTKESEIKPKYQNTKRNNNSVVIRRRSTK